jgi:hypothetical protein
MNADKEAAHHTGASSAETGNETRPACSGQQDREEIGSGPQTIGLGRAPEPATQGSAIKAVIPNEKAAATYEDVTDALFPIEKSIRYHQRRRKFYDSWHRWMMFAVILSGSASVTDFFKAYQIFLGLLVAVIAAADVVFALSDRARDHEFLMRRFCHLIAKIRRCVSPTQLDIQNWRVERIEIETEEPAVYWALEAACYNEALRALDRHPEDEVFIPWYYSITKNLMQFDPTRFQPIKDRRQPRAA